MCIRDSYNTGTHGEFKITDLDGTEYYYDGDGYNAYEINSSNLYCPLIEGNSYDEYANAISAYVSSWKCTKIVSPNKKDLINLTYAKQEDSYSFSGKDMIVLHYNKNVSSIHEDRIPREEQVLEKIRGYQYYNSSVLRDEKVDYISSVGDMKRLDELWRISNSENPNYCIYDAPVYFTKHFTGSGSCVVVPTRERDNLIVDDNRLKAKVTIRRQSRTRLSAVDNPNGAAIYSYNSNGQLKEINIMEGDCTNSRQIKKIIFHQSEHVDANASCEIYSEGYLDNTTSYLDKLEIKNNGLSLSYGFKYQSQVGFCNNAKPMNKWGHKGPNYMGGVPSINWTVVSDIEVEYPLQSIVMGPDFGNWDYTTESINKRFSNNPGTGDCFAGVLNSISYPTGLEEVFYWEPNKFYNLEQHKENNEYKFEVGSEIAGGCRIKKIESFDEKSRKKLRSRIFKYGENECGNGFIKPFIYKPISSKQVNTNGYIDDYNSVSYTHLRAHET